MEQLQGYAFVFPICPFNLCRWWEGHKSGYHKIAGAGFTHPVNPVYVEVKGDAQAGRYSGYGLSLVTVLFHRCPSANGSIVRLTPEGSLLTRFFTC